MMPISHGIESDRRRKARVVLRAPVTLSVLCDFLPSGRRSRRIPRELHWNLDLSFEYEPPTYIMTTYLIWTYESTRNRVECDT